MDLIMDMIEEIEHDQLEMLVRDARASGCAVVVMTPENLHEADPEVVEAAMAKAGWTAIEKGNTGPEQA